jgi:undecaprenyl-diphosphatase
MNNPDIAILSILNEMVQQSRTFDVFLVHLLSNTPLKGLLFASLMWWTWFRSEETKRTDREVILSILLASFLSLIISQLMQVVLPFRPRPAFLSDLELRIPYGATEYAVRNMSSFPSDHAAFFYALATGFWFLSRPLGAILLMNVTVFICLPRIILGFHYPTDIVVGGLIAFAVVYLVHRFVPVGRLRNIAERWETKSPGTLYACLFIVTYLIAALFEPIRALEKFLSSIVATVL